MRLGISADTELRQAAGPFLLGFTLAALNPALIATWTAAVTAVTVRRSVLRAGDRVLDGSEELRQRVELGLLERAGHAQAEHRVTRPRRPGDGRLETHAARS